jgi:hypothetical protein
MNSISGSGPMAGRARSMVRALATAMVAAGCMVFSMGASAEGASQQVTPDADGYTKYLVFRGDGLWRSVDGSLMVGGISQGNGIAFQREIMKRSDAQIETHRQEAIAFMKQRYGLDVTVPSNDFIFTDIQIDPQNRLRAYTVSGESAPAGGWEVRDGGWGLFVMNPNGVMLGGQFAGVHLAGGSAIFYGDYNVLVERADGTTEEIVIHYDSDLPFSFDPFGAGPIRCRLISEKYGVGFAGGMVNPRFLDNNFLMQQDIRNVLMFSKDQ